MATVGYMTNAFGPLVGTGGGVTSMKDVGYLTLENETVLLKKVSDVGFKYFEMFEGNICNFAKNPKDFLGLMKKHNISLLGVYVGCHFIYPDALPDEIAKVHKVATLAKEFGAKHLVLGGGSIRAKGIQEDDYKLLASGIDAVSEVVKEYGLTPSYHPHLGSLAETPQQIDKLFSLSNTLFCPDIAHLIAGGCNIMQILEKYYDRIPYIHLKDIDNGAFVPLGKGQANIRGIVQFFLSKGYEGDWLAEIDGYPGDPEEACKTSFDFLKGLLI
ncbi:MAG: sugar phosphate isomerase/epimerase [Defluviitaleaceae bacterium]|nr:sugar phosphate isomerase/epimerase [Defluviitaleaceae bacterium]